ncbi:MAG: transporter substrate-binding protein [Nocardia sp.]|uniref:extracellular solute-binding protein n=1 Tax=Nocardia sp. TaxID=1821 RepID=UPI00263559DE|nr:extracellular solute-binding protein [Nocardia sp.]MCU1647273.1 transporter substrate-binding protein [Nocardia sp.]
MATRRAVLRAGALLPLTAACAPDVFGAHSDAVRIAVPWGGSELEAFQTVLAGLSFGPRTEVIPLGDDVSTAFGAGRSAPDIVMFQHAGQVRGLAEDKLLRPIEGAAAGSMWTDENDPRYAAGWWSLLHAGPGSQLYGVPFKGTYKSLIWYDKRTLGDSPAPGGQIWPLSEWPARMDGMAGGGSRRLLALGAADGWVLNDFFENVLWAGYPDTYASVADPARWQQDRDRNRAEMSRALGDLAAVWRHSYAFPGGIGECLTRQFPDAVRQVFEQRSAAMVVAPDFAEPIVRSCFGNDDDRVDAAVGVAPFPGGAGGTPAIAGGDVMVLTRAAKDSAVQLVSLLAQRAAALPWITGYHGFLSPNRQTPAVYSPQIAPAAARFGNWTAFDLGDRIDTAAASDRLLRTITEFLTDLDSGKTEEAVRHAVDAVDDLQHQRSK